MTDVSTTALTNADLAPDATPLTTGASPFTADVDVRHYAITTGGTAGEEIIDLPTDPLGIAYLGAHMLLRIETLTNPADFVTITVGGTAPVFTITGVFSQSDRTASLKLTQSTHFAMFVWVGNTWKLELLEMQATVDLAKQDVFLDAVGVTAGNGKPFSIHGGGAHGIGVDAGTGGSADVVGGYSDDGIGGAANIIGGDTGSSGAGGDVVIQGGTSTSGANGNVKILALPTANPGVADALWNNGGVLSVSAG